MSRVVAAMDRVTDLREEDRMRHRRVVPLFGEVVALEPEGPERTAWRVIADPAGRDLPHVARCSVDKDGHALGTLVHDDEEIRGRRSGADEKTKDRRRNCGPQRRHTHLLPHWNARC